MEVNPIYVPVKLTGVTVTMDLQQIKDLVAFIGPSNLDTVESVIGSNDRAKEVNDTLFDLYDGLTKILIKEGVKF